MRWVIPSIILGTALLLGAYRSVIFGGNNSSGTGLISLIIEVSQKLGLPSEWLEGLVGIELPRPGSGLSDRESPLSESPSHTGFSPGISFDDSSTEFKLPECQPNAFSLDQLVRHQHLSILGHVFDVSTNLDMYGTEGGYADFTGHEGTHHFIFGLQVKGSTQSALDGLSYWQLDELLNWLKFYVNKYPCIGFVIGPYYETNGDPTIHLKSLERTWIEMRLQRNNLMKIFPPCNQFYEDDKSIYWCPPSVSANGETILRPRQLLEPGKVLARCACVQPELLSHPRLQTYLNCPPEATRCVYTADNQEHTSWSHLGLLINFG